MSLGRDISTVQTLVSSAFLTFPHSPVLFGTGKSAAYRASLACWGTTTSCFPLRYCWLPSYASVLVLTLTLNCTLPSIFFITIATVTCTSDADEPWLGNNYLIIFGGMGHKPEGSTNDDLVVLNDVRFFDIQTFHWLPPDPSLSRDGSSASPSTADPIDPVASGSSSLRAGGEFTPRARYAHLSSVSGARLYVVGGQDLQNAWLDDVCVYDLRARRWAARRDYPRHAGTYRSVAVAAQLRMRDPACEAEARTATTISERAGASLGPPGGRFTLDRRPPSAKGEYTPSENLIHLPYSTDPTDDFPNDIFLYSNYNVSENSDRSCSLLTPRSLQM